MAKMYVVTAKGRNGEWKYLGSTSEVVKNKVNVKFSFEDFFSKAAFFADADAAAAAFDRFKDKMDKRDIVPSTVRVCEIKFLPKLKIEV